MTHFAARSQLLRAKQALSVDKRHLNKKERFHNSEILLCYAMASSDSPCCCATETKHSGLFEPLLRISLNKNSQGAVTLLYHVRCVKEFLASDRVLAVENTYCHGTTRYHPQWRAPVLQIEKVDGPTGRAACLKCCSQDDRPGVRFYAKKGTRRVFCHLDCLLEVLDSETIVPSNRGAAAIILTCMLEGKSEEQTKEFLEQKKFIKGQKELFRHLNHAESLEEKAKSILHEEGVSPIAHHFRFYGVIRPEKALGPGGSATPAEWLNRIFTGCEMRSTVEMGWTKQAEDSYNWLLRNGYATDWELDQFYARYPENLRNLQLAWNDLSCSHEHVSHIHIFDCLLLLEKLSQSDNREEVLVPCLTAKQRHLRNFAKALVEQCKDD